VVLEHQRLGRLPVFQLAAVGGAGGGRVRYFDVVVDFDSVEPGSEAGVGGFVARRVEMRGAKLDFQRLPFERRARRVGRGRGDVINGAFGDFAGLLAEAVHELDFVGVHQVNAAVAAPRAEAFGIERVAELQIDARVAKFPPGKNRAGGGVDFDDAAGQFEPARVGSVGLAEVAQAGRFVEQDDGVGGAFFGEGFGKGSGGEDDGEAGTVGTGIKLNGKHRVAADGQPGADNPVAAIRPAFARPEQQERAVGLHETGERQRLHAALEHARFVVILWI
jgi:hypothetical protein